MVRDSIHPRCIVPYKIPLFLNLGICGTDAHIHEGEFIASFPVITGHECERFSELGVGALTNLALSRRCG